MSEGQPPYRLDQVADADEQIRSIASIARQAGKLHQFIDVLVRARHLLKNEPHHWGDPVHDVAKGQVYRGLVRPVAFRYVVFEQIRSVVLLELRLYAEFDEQFP